MAGRASLLMNCSKIEAQEIRARAILQRRTVSGYVLNIVLRAVGYDDHLSARVHSLRDSLSAWSRRTESPGPRTTMHLHCSVEEARRIRDAATRRSTTMSAFVLHCLHLSWQAVSEVLPPEPPFSIPGRARS